LTKYVFLDTETTGLNPDVCEIWEIGAILREEGGRDVEYGWQIRPSLVGAEPTGLRIGRYYQRSLVTRAQFGEAWKLRHPSNDPGDTERDPARWTNGDIVAAELAHMLDGAFLVGAVPWFDERFLQRFLAQRNQSATNHYHLVDVETLAAGALGLKPKWDFDSVLDAYGLKYDEADRHTALGDARMARDLFDAVYGQHETRPDPTN
jgi:DNA polymerase III epsilon subunit-like protein